MKNFNEYIIEKLKVTKNKQLTLGDIYKISKLNCGMWASMEPEIFFKKIDELFGINKLYELQNEYTDYFEEYKDNYDNSLIKNEDIKKLCKILLNIMLSVPADAEIYDGLKQLIEDCNIPPHKAKLLKFTLFNTKLMYDGALLVYFELDKR